MWKKNILFGEISDAMISRTLTLPLRLFKKHALAQSGVKLHKFYLAFSRLTILASPDNMLGLRGFQP